MSDQAAELGIQIPANGQGQPAMTPQACKHVAALARVKHHIAGNIETIPNRLTSHFGHTEQSFYQAAIAFEAYVRNATNNAEAAVGDGVAQAINPTT